MSKHSVGLKFAGFEHRWENYTNISIIIGVITTIVFYYYHLSFIIPLINFYVSTAEIGIFFLFLIGFCHLIARLGHEGEQHFLKSSRPWKKKGLF